MNKPALLCVFAAALSTACLAFASDSPREHLLLDRGWKFHLRDDWPTCLVLAWGGVNSGAASEKFDDVLWRTVNLPHDWAVELPFDEHSDKLHGFKPVGPDHADTDTGWYRRQFKLPAADAGKRIRLQFDGAFRDTLVFVNGWLMGHQESGYTPFRVDITDVVRFDKPNTIAVKVDASRFEGWFYEGAGLYRHVWLDVTAPVAVAPDGVFVTSRFPGNVPKGPAAIEASVVVANDGLTPVTAKAGGTVTRAEGGSEVRLASTSGEIAPGETRTFHLKGSVEHPALWSPESPALYRLATTVTVDGKTADRVATTFGIRTVAFDKDRGFLLNGKPCPLYGTCNHQDHAGVGAALPDALQEFRIEKLREFSNAYRTSHNPPTPELLDACDRLGMIVMDENRLLGSSAQNLELLRTLVLRDRNHPSVCMWSLCNEEAHQSDEEGGRVGLTMQRLVKKLDPTRPVTAAENRGDVGTGLMSALEVRGWNYQIGPDIDAYRAKHPDQPHVGTEQGSTVTTRGEYETNAEKGFVEAYRGPENWWKFFAERPWLSGGFVWTGFDYRGEPTPYGWPCVSSHFGIIDTCGFPKDNWWYYRAWWSKDPVLHLMPHWNWPGKEGRKIRVDAFSNAHEVELFLNGASLGRQEMKPNARLTWQVPYASGTLSAKGYDAAGKTVSETSVETTGAPAALALKSWKPTLRADGEDLAIVSIAANDGDGRIVPTSSNNVRLTVSGPAELIGVGNGNPSCHEPDLFLPAPAVQSIPVGGWTGKALAIPAKPTNPRTPYLPILSAFVAQTDLTSLVPGGADGVLIPSGTGGICTATFTLGAEDLKAVHVLRLHGFDGLHLFVNGTALEVALSGSGDIPSMVDRGLRYHLPGKLLHVGENRIIAISDGGPVKPDASLERLLNPKQPAWSRSLFNGHGQAILRSTGAPGDVTLTAEAEGLKPAAVVVKALPSAPRPAVPVIP